MGKCIEFVAIVGNTVCFADNEGERTFPAQRNATQEFLIFRHLLLTTAASDHLKGKDPRSRTHGREGNLIAISVDHRGRNGNCGSYARRTTPAWTQ